MDKIAGVDVDHFSSDLIKREIASCEQRLHSEFTAGFVVPAVFLATGLLVFAVARDARPLVGLAAFALLFMGAFWWERRSLEYRLIRLERHFSQALQKENEDDIEEWAQAESPLSLEEWRYRRRQMRLGIKLPPRLRHVAGHQRYPGAIR